MGSYVSCLYEKEWYDGINEEVSVEENDGEVFAFHWSISISSLACNWSQMLGASISRITIALIPTVKSSRCP